VALCSILESGKELKVFYGGFFREFLQGFLESGKELKATNLDDPYILLDGLAGIRKGIESYPEFSSGTTNISSWNPERN